MNNVQALGRLLAAACMLAAAFAPSESRAANVGYFGGCWNGDVTPSITRAGHTPVRVTALDAASLAGLSTLLIQNCSFAKNATVDDAVARGMSLVIHDWQPGPSTAGKLPGTPAVSILGGGGSQMDLAAGSPIATGAGGTLTDSSLDGGMSSNHGYATRATLPAGAIAMTTTPDPNQVVTFAYSHGSGRVVYGAMPLDAYLPGADLDGNVAAPGMQAYITNVIEWATGPGFTTCAAEGFTGSKLTLCRKICEIDQTPTALSGLIKLYRSAYRENPPCAN
jgi:hypothetical protein